MPYLVISAVGRIKGHYSVPTVNDALNQKKKEGEFLYEVDENAEAFNFDELWFDRDVGELQERPRPQVDKQVKTPVGFMFVASQLPEGHVEVTRLDGRDKFGGNRAEMSSIINIQDGSLHWMPTEKGEYAMVFNLPWPWQSPYEVKVTVE